MTMKKLLALLLALCMLLSLTACAETEQEEEKQEEERVEFEETDEEKSLSFLDPDSLSSGGAAAETPAEEAEEPEEESAEEPAEEPAEEAPVEEPAETPAEAPAAGDLPALPVFSPSGTVPTAFEEVVLLDEDYATVTLKGYNPEDSWGAELELELVNKADYEIMFAARETSVNGIAFDPAWANSVPAGQTETSWITFDWDRMEDYGINYLQEILLGFDIYNNEDWQADHLFVDSFTILLPAAGSGAPNTMPECNLTGLTVVDSPDCAIAIVNYEKNGYYGPELKVLAINRTDENIYVSSDDLVINGVMINERFAVEMLPGTVAYRNLELDSEELEACGIRYLQDVQVFFDVNTVEGYENLYNGTISFTLEEGSGPAVEEVHYEGFEEVTLVEEDGITIVAKNFEMEGYFGPTLTLYVKNTSGDKVWVDLETAWINGVEMDPFWSTMMLDGTVCYGVMDWYDDDFAEAGITDVETIKLDFYVERDSDWETLFEGTVTLFLN